MRNLRPLLALLVLAATPGLVVVLEAPEVAAAPAVRTEVYPWVSDACGEVLSLPADLVGGATAAWAVPTAGAKLAPGAAAAGGAGSTVGASSAAAGGSIGLGTGALAAVVFVGGFCGTIKGLEWATGWEPSSPPAQYVGGFVELEAPPEPCSTIDYQAWAPGSWTPNWSGSYCFIVALPGGVPFTYAGLSYVNSTGTIIAEPNGNLHRLYFSQGDTSWEWKTPNFYGAFAPENQGYGWMMVEVPCDAAEICPLYANGEGADGNPLDRSLAVQVNQHDTTPDDYLVLDYEAFASGAPKWLTYEAECKEPGGASRTVTGKTDVYRGLESGPPLSETFDVCDPDEALVEIDVNEATPTISSRFLGALPEAFNERPANYKHTLDWTMPDPLKNDALALQCWLDGMTNCTAEIIDGNTVRITNTQTQQSTDVSVNTGTTVGQVLDPLFEELLPEEDPNAPPATTVPPATTTTIPDTDENEPPCPGPGCPAPPPDPEDDPGDGEGGSCWPTGWGWFNPIEWVYRPIVCAMRWLFIPPQPEWDNALSDLAAYRSEPPLQWADGLATMVGGTSVDLVAWRDAQLGSIGGFPISGLDVADVPDWLETLIVGGLYFLVGYAVVRFL